VVICWFGDNSGGCGVAYALRNKGLIMKPEYEIKVVECSLCGETKEAAVFQSKLWIFTVIVALCQSCVSKIFGSFSRER